MDFPSTNVLYYNNSRQLICCIGGTPVSYQMIKQSKMSPQGMMFLLSLALVTGLAPLVTEREPSMFEEDDVLIDYEESFIIPD